MALKNALYAVAVVTNGRLYLLERIARSQTGIYCLFPRDTPETRLPSGQAWNPHASYHTDGSRWSKSYDQKMVQSKRQPLDAHFRGAEILFDLTLRPGEIAAHDDPCNPAAFAGIVAVSGDLLSPQDHITIAVDILEPGSPPSPRDWLLSIVECTFKDDALWIHVMVAKSLIPLEGSSAT